MPKTIGQCIILERGINCSLNIPCSRQLEGMSPLDDISVEQAQRQPKICQEREAEKTASTPTGPGAHTLSSWPPLATPAISHGIILQSRAELPNFISKMLLKSLTLIHEIHPGKIIIFWIKCIY